MVRYRPSQPTRMKSQLVLFTGLLPLALSAADLPPLVLPAGVGVNIHFVSGHGRDLDLIAAAGFKFVRMDFGWQGIERNKGEYDWSGYDALTSDLEKRGLRAIYILDYSHPLYEETVSAKNPINGRPEERVTASPQHSDSVAAYARWAAAAARHFQGRRIVWEIWNEPNIFFWRPKPNAPQYATLAVAAAKAVREADPQATILAPAASGFPWEFIETLFQAGALDYLDAVSVHPYRDYKRSPETAAADYHKLRELMDRYAPAEKKGKLPIVSGEWGYATHTKGVSPETQAAFLVRQQLANLLDGVPLSIWYDWKNDGDDPAEREHNFGTVSPDLSPKPAYRALQTMTRELGGYHIVRRQATDSDADFVLLLRNAAGQAKVAAWTVGEPHPAVLKLVGRAAAAIPLTVSAGVVGVVRPERSALTIRLTALPQYLTLGEASLAE